MNLDMDPTAIDNHFVFNEGSFLVLSKGGKVLLIKHYGTN
jgi:hypothetical protein